MKKFYGFCKPGLMAGALLLGGMALNGCDRHNPPPSLDATSAASSTVASTAAATPHGGFVIRGDFPTLEDGAVVRLLMFDPTAEGQDKRRPVATGKAENGHFLLTGSVAQPMPGLLQVGTASTEMIVENAPFQVVDTGAGLLAEGGNYNDKVYGYRAMPAYVKAFQKRHALYKKAFDGIDEMDEAAMSKARKATSGALKAELDIANDYQAGILQGDGSPLLKLFVLHDNHDNQRFDKDKRAAMLSEYASDLGEDHPLIVQMRNTAAGYRKYEKLQDETSVGKQFKDVVAMDKDGNKVELSDVLAKNKLVLLDFWASWCGPCRGEFPHLSKVYKEFHEHGFEIYAVSLDDDRDEWLKALREEGDAGRIPWINLVDPGIDSASAVSYGVLGLPSNFLISGDGKIVGVNMREWDVEREVRAQVSKLEDHHGA